MAEGSRVPNCKQRSKVESSILGHQGNFSTQIAKKINKALSVWEKVICSDSYKDVYLE